MKDQFELDQDPQLEARGARQNGAVLKRAAVFGAIVTAIVSLFGAAQAIAILPYRLAAAEKSIESLRSDHDLLLRIEERLKAVQDKLDKKDTRP